MTPLERAARALHERNRQMVRVRDPENPRDEPVERPLPFVGWDDLPQYARDGYARAARAVLTAIREPDEAMMGALDGLHDYWDYLADGMIGEAAATGHRAMIDAILAGGE